MIKSSFISGGTADKVVSFSVKIDIYTVAEPVRSIGGSMCVWTSTVVIVHHA